MKKYFNKTALLESMGIIFLSLSILYILISGRIREFTGPRTDLILYLSSFLILFWGLYNLKNVNKWRRKVNYLPFILTILPAIFLLAPHRVMSANTFIAGNNFTEQKGALAYDFKKSAKDLLKENAKEDFSYSIKEISEADKKRIVEEENRRLSLKNAENKLKSKKIENPKSKTSSNNKDSEGFGQENKNTLTVELDNNKKYELSGFYSQEKKIKVSDEDYFIWMNEIFKNPEKYEGYTIELKAMSMMDKKMGINNFLISKYLITCCIADATPAGIFASFDTAKLTNGAWYKFLGKLEFDKNAKNSSPKIRLLECEKIQPPKDPYIYYFQYQ